MTTYGLYLRDLSHARTQSHGIVNYALGLANALPGVLAAQEQLVIVANTEIAAALPLDHPRVTVDAGRPPPRGAARLFSDQVGSLKTARGRGVAVLHFPKGFVPLVNLTGVRVVATLHDDIPVRYWEGAWGREHRSPQTAYFAANVRHAARHADAVLTVSDFTRDQLQRRWRGVDPRVTGQAVTLPPTPFVPVSDRTPAALVFGSSLPHKRAADGIARTLRWIAANPGGGLDEVQVIGGVGRLGDVASHPRLRLLGGGHSNAEIARLIARSRLLVFPSAYEGFGLPPLEATLLGTPVVFAKIPVLTEVLGPDAPGAYEPDEGSFAHAVGGALAQDDQMLRRRAASMASRHRWDAVATTTVGVYRRLLTAAPTGR